MNKTNLLSIAALAAVTVILHCSSCQAASVSQIDRLKAQFLPAEYRNTNFTLDDMKKIYREKCKKISGIDNSTLYQEIEKSATTLATCVSSLANLTAIQEEIELARPIGELDSVFHKYCEKAPLAEKCLRTFNAKVQPCLSAEEKNQNAVLMRLISSLMGFMCTRGGDQIALFVAEEGPECLEANKEAIANCMNSSFSEYLPKDGSMPDFFNLPELVLAPQHCVDLEQFERCTLHHLEQCQEITPANVAESVFKFIKNETSCKSWIDAKSSERSVLRDPRNGVAGLQRMALLSIVFGSLFAVLLRNIF